MYSYNAVGMYEYTRTGQLLPILIGTNMEEIGGSGMQVPILGVEKDKQSGQVQYISLSYMITCALVLWYFLCNRRCVHQGYQLLNGQ